MLKNTHTEVGLSLYLWFIIYSQIFFLILINLFGLNLWNELYFPIYSLLILPILAVLPDSDHPWSLLNKKFPFLKIISKFWWHRTWSHDIVTIFIVSMLIYVWFTSLFWYTDFQTPWNELSFTDKWQFFIFSKEFWSIFFTTFAHTLADNLTKGKVATFYWFRLICDKLKKVHPFLVILVLPLYLFVLLEDLVNYITSNFMPLTGSKWETYYYAFIFNIINIYAIYFILFNIFPENWFQWFVDLVRNTTSKLNNLYFVLVFFIISIIYFFWMSFQKVKQYADLMKKSIIFLVIASIFIFVIWYAFNYIQNIEQNIKLLVFWWIWCGWLYFLYKKYVNMKFDYFNILLNEVVISVFYLIIIGIIFFPK